MTQARSVELCHRRGFCKLTFPDSVTLFNLNPFQYVKEALWVKWEGVPSPNFVNFFTWTSKACCLWSRYLMGLEQNSSFASGFGELLPGRAHSYSLGPDWGADNLLFLFFRRSSLSPQSTSSPPLSPQAVNQFRHRDQLMPGSFIPFLLKVIWDMLWHSSCN